MRNLMKMASAMLAAMTFVGGVIATFLLLNVEVTDATTASMLDRAAIGVMAFSFIQATVLMTLCVTLETVMETNALLVDELTRAAARRGR